MGAFAAWLNGAIPTDAAQALSTGRTLVVSDFEPSPTYLRRCLGKLPQWVALPTVPTTPLSEVKYCGYQPATNPLHFDERAAEALRDGVDTVAFFLPPEDVWGRTLLHLHRAGVRQVLLFERGRSIPYRPLVLAAWRKMQALGRRARRLVLGDPSPLQEAEVRELLANAPPRRISPRLDGPLRIAHFICSLNSGGAERQVCYAALAQKHAGHDVRVLTRVALQGDHAHYRYLLDPHGIPVRQIGSIWNDDMPEAWQRLGLSDRFHRRLPRDLATQVADLVGDLLCDPVDVLHCYVDDCNVPGAIAGCLTGTPGIVLSFRNGNPSHFPGLLRDWMHPCYRAVLGRRDVVLSSNSDMGARDYESWLGLESQSVAVVRNAFHGGPRPDAQDALAWRRQLGIADSAPLVAGVFRLHPEKRPLYFLDCVHRIRQLVPELRVVVAGVGVLEAAVRQKIAECGLQQVVHLLGQTQNVPLVLAASDALLLVSDWEGTPNILLEAQHYGCVPVATDAGGSPEALLDQQTGMLVGQDDLEGTCQAVVGLLRDAERRRRMAVAGGAFVARSFAPQLLDEGNLRLYATALGESGHTASMRQAS